MTNLNYDHSLHSFHFNPSNFFNFAYVFYYYDDHFSFFAFD